MNTENKYVTTHEQILVVTSARENTFKAQLALICGYNFGCGRSSGYF